MATASACVVDVLEEIRTEAKLIPDNSVSCYTFVFGGEGPQSEHLCSVYNNSRDNSDELLKKFTKSESDNLCRFITKLGLETSSTSTDVSINTQLLRTASSDTDDFNEEEECHHNGPPLSVTLHQCALVDFYLNPKPSKSKDKRPVFVNVCHHVISRVLCLPQLVELNLANCDFSDSDEEIVNFGVMHNLKLLNLDSMNLRRLHPSVGKLQNLRLLSVQYNRLSDFPLTLRLLRKLEYLNITGNPFTTIPGAVFHLHSLKALEGLNFCPLQKKNNPIRWKREDLKISWCQPLVKPPPREEVESLQDICSRRAVGMDCWAIPLPERHRQVLTERAITYDLCQNCLRPVKKLTVETETDGYSIFVILVVFCGQRNVPFNFFACSEVCKDSVVRWLMELQSSLERVYRNCYMPCCTYSLQFVQDLPEVQRNHKRRIEVMTQNWCYT